MIGKVVMLSVSFLLTFGLTCRAAGEVRTSGADQQTTRGMTQMSETTYKDWRSRWERNIVSPDAMRYCSAEMGEEIGWKMGPFLNGFYYGYLATGNVMLVDALVRCTDLWIKRALKEPDGYIGWPKVGAAGTEVDKLDNFYADSMLGEAMAFSPVIRMASEIRKTAGLKEKYGERAEGYIALSEKTFEKWDTRGAWRETDTGGIVTVELPFGIDRSTGKWDEYATRNAPGNGFSHPDNKANLIALWLLALFDTTNKHIYVERAQKWFQVMKSRMKLKADGTYPIWNYWEPAGSWDYKSDGAPKHWVGVHPRAGYYDFDVEAIVAAYEHGLIFGQEEINRLIATALLEKRYWTALVPYDRSIQNQFEKAYDPGSWGALQTVPWYLSLQVEGRRPH
jgi:hypothetical protein